MLFSVTQGYLNSCAFWTPGVVRSVYVPFREFGNLLSELLTVFEFVSIVRTVILFL